MRVKVDESKCQGHARCEAICPGVFELDDEGQKSRVKVDVVPAELRDSAEEAEASCPEGAISTEE